MPNKLLVAVVLGAALITVLTLIYQRPIVADACTSSPTLQMDFEQCGGAPLPGNALPLLTSEMREPPELTTLGNDVLLGYVNRAPITTDGRNSTIIGQPDRRWIEGVQAGPGASRSDLNMLVAPSLENGETLCTTSEGQFGAHRAGTVFCSPLQVVPK